MNRVEIQEMSRKARLLSTTGTKIESTRPPGRPPGRSWNPWHGCRYCAPECGKPAPGNPQPKGAGCYAEREDSRNLHPHLAGVTVDGKWSELAIRNTETQWEAPKHYAAGTLCFTCSMSDFWFEAVPLEWQIEALDRIEEAYWVLFLMLTKRPAIAIRRLAQMKRTLPADLWFGATCGHPQSLPLLRPLRRIEATKKFLSVESLLAPMVPGLDLTDIDWVIAGGESGPRHRPCLPEWVRAVRDLCLVKQVPFFFKQWGHASNNPDWENELARSSKGGATLDGRLWREFPELPPILPKP
jgi:protein gp37